MNFKNLMLILVVLSTASGSLKAGLEDQIMKFCTTKNAGVALMSAVVSYAVVPSKTITKAFCTASDSDLEKNFMEQAYSFNMKKTKANLVILALRGLGTVAAYRILQRLQYLYL